MSASDNVPLPDSLIPDLVIPKTLPASQPDDTILFMAQLVKAEKDLEGDPSFKAIAQRELKFFKMAAKIVADATGSKANIPEYQAIKIKFGTGVDAVQELAKLLKEVAQKKQAETILTKVTEDVKNELNGFNVFT